MKIRFKPRIHNCDKHLIETNYLYDEYGVIEYDIVCEVCNKVKNHWAYGYLLNKKSWEKNKKCKIKDLPF